MVTVSEIAILRSMLFLWERLKIVVEPTGALAAAALLEGIISAPNSRIGVIISGGNVDLKQASKFLAKASAQEKPERLFPLSQELS
jgi:threonine dehydratase